MLGWSRLLSLTSADNATTNRNSERMGRGLKETKSMSYNCSVLMRWRPLTRKKK